MSSPKPNWRSVAWYAIRNLIPACPALTLKDLDMQLKIGCDVARFLCVDIQRHPEDRSLHFVQEGLAKRIVESFGVGHLPVVSALADGPLVKDEHGEP